MDTAETAETGAGETGETAETGAGETAEPVIDNDGDGYAVEVDCTDVDPLVYPGAVDAPCDGVDANCDGVGVDDVVLVGEVRYPDVASAVAAAADGDAVDVCPGIHVANLEIDTPRAITLRSVSGSNADTELSGGSHGPVLVVGVDLTLENLGAVDGLAQYRNETNRQTGGGIYAEDARLTLRGVRVENNSAQDDGAGVAIVLGEPSTSALLVEDSTFTDNRASEDGGAIAVFAASEADVDVCGSTFGGNRAPSRGAAVYLAGAPLAARIADCTFDGNDASGARSYGGAVAAEGASVTLPISDSSFSTNTAGNSAGALSMIADASTLTVTDSTFSSNTATQAGGAVCVDSAATSVLFSSTLFDGNLANTRGGAVELDGGGDARLEDAYLTDNSAGDAGGGLYLDAGDGAVLTVALSGGVLTTNRAGIGGGGGIYANDARVEASGVDFGEDTTTNTPEDVYGCDTDFGSGASFVYDAATGARCE